MGSSLFLPIALLLYFSAPVLAEVEFSKTLEAALEATITRSETMAGQTEAIRQAEERYSQALAGVLPTLTLTGSYLRQEQPLSATGTAISPGEQPLVRLTLTQPLFRGFREFAGLRQASALKDAQTEFAREARRLLFLDVAATYYNILQLESDLKNIDSEIEFFDKRIGELRDRVGIGRSRLTEVTAVEASRSSLKAERERTRGQLLAAREMVGFFTGWSITEPLKSPNPLPAKLEPLEVFTQNLVTRPDVLAAQHQWMAAQENTRVQRGGHYPTVDLAGNYYFKRMGALKDVKWDLGVFVTIPIFNGGVINARVGEAASQEISAELQVRRSKRSADQQVRSLYELVQSGLAQVGELHETVQLSEKSFKELSREYRLGLVNNLEVLQAMVAFEQSSRTYDRSRLSTELDYLRLQTAAMRIPYLERR